MIVPPIAPPPPDPVYYQYPSGRGIAYVPILDGVAARLRYTNKGSSDRGFTCSLPTGKVVTTNMAQAPAPLAVQPWSPGSSDAWAQARTSVVEDNTGGVRKILFSYDGGSIPAMSANVNPAGWELFIHPWLIHDGSYDNGFEVTYGEGADINIPTAFYVAFVPYFKIVAASTTPAVTDGTDQTWYLYFAKPLNSNQTSALQVTITTGMFGTVTGLAYVVETNAYGQATALRVTLPMATKHVLAAGVYKITVYVTQNLYYLKGDNFVTESVILISQDFDVTVGIGVDTTAPSIASPMILPRAAATAAQQPSILQVQIPGPVGYTDCIAARQTLACDVTENGGGLDRVELWVEWGSNTPKLITTSTFGGARGVQHVEIDTQTLPPLGYDNPLGTPLWTRFLFKAYDMAGNVASAYAASPINGNIGVQTSNPAVMSITPLGGSYTASTGKWNAVSGFYAKISAPAAFVEKVEFYVDNVLQATQTGAQGVPDANGALVAWGDIVGYTGNFTGLGAGTHVLKAIVYNAVPNGPYSVQTTHTLESTITVGTTSGGTGCVDLNALITLGNQTTKRAYEVQVGDEVLVRDPLTGALAIRPIGHILPMAVQPCYRIIAEDGIGGICSASHRVFETSSGAFWTVEDLRPGQFILSPSDEPKKILEIIPESPREVITFAIDDPTHRNYFADGILAHNKISQDCVVPGTLVTMADGSQKPIEALVPGDQVLAWDTQTKTFVADTFLSHYITRRSDLLRVTLEDGHTVTCTPTHTLFTGQVWVPVDQLRRFSSPVKIMVEGGAFSAIQSIDEVNEGEVEVRLGEIQTHHNLILGGILCHNIKYQPMEP